MYPKTVADFLGMPAQQMLFAGMAAGHAKADAPVNAWPAPRAPVDEEIRIHGA